MESYAHQTVYVTLAAPNQQRLKKVGGIIELEVVAHQLVGTRDGLQNNMPAKVCVMYVRMNVCIYGWMDGWMDVCMYV